MMHDKIAALREEMLGVALADYREGGKWPGRMFAVKHIQYTTRMHYMFLSDRLNKLVEAGELISDKKGDSVYYQFPRFPDVVEKYQPLCWEEEVMKNRPKAEVGEAAEPEAEAEETPDDDWLGYKKGNFRQDVPAMTIRKDGASFSWNKQAAALYRVSDRSTAVYRFDKDGNLQIRAVPDGSARIRKTKSFSYVLSSTEMLEAVEAEGREVNFVYPITVDEHGVWTVWLNDKSLGAMATLGRERK